MMRYSIIRCDCFPVKNNRNSYGAKTIKRFDDENLALNEAMSLGKTLNKNYKEILYVIDDKFKIPLYAIKRTDKYIEMCVC